MEIKSQEDMERAVYAAVNLACRHLTDIELNAQYLVSMSGFDPKPVLGYEKISHLFDQDDGKRMHEETKLAFQRVARNRLAAAWDEVKAQ